MATIYIEDAQDWLDLCNGVYGRGTTTEKLQVELRADIDLSDVGDDYIGMTAETHCDIEGNGNTIKNAVTSVNGSCYILRIGLTSTIKNLTFENMHITTSGTGNFYFIWGGVSLENIRWKNSCDVVCGNNVYMVVLSANGSANCVGVGGTVEMAQSGSAKTYSGIYSTSNNTTIQNCYITGTIDADVCNVRLYYATTAYNCYATAEIACANYRFTDRQNIAFGYDACQVTASGTIEPATFASSQSGVFPYGVYFVVDFYTQWAALHTDYRDSNGISLANLKNAEYMKSKGWAVVTE